MSKNAQILLENLIEQEFRNNDNYSNISEYFEFFSASQILKNQGLSDDEVDNGIVGKGLDGGCDSIYLDKIIYLLRQMLLNIYLHQKIPFWK